MKRKDYRKWDLCPFCRKEEKLESSNKCRKCHSKDKGRGLSNSKRGNKINT